MDLLLDIFFLVYELLLYFILRLLPCGFYIDLFLVAFLRIQTPGMHVYVMFLQNVFGSSLVSVLQVNFKIVLSNFNDMPNTYC